MRVILAFYHIAFYYAITGDDSSQRYNVKQKSINLRTRKALLLFAREPVLLRRFPDEPYGGLPWTDLDALFSAMLDDVLESAFQLENTEIHLFRSEAEFSLDFLDRQKIKIQEHEIEGDTFSEQVEHAFEIMFAEKYELVIALLENNPLIDKHTIQTAFEQLQYDDDCIVIGETEDGKCSLVGMKSDHSELFTTDDEDILNKPNLFYRRVCETDVIVFPMRPLYSLDSGTNLNRLKIELEEKANGNGFSKHTRVMFKSLDKKYKIRRHR